MDNFFLSSALIFYSLQRRSNGFTADKTILSQGSRGGPTFYRGRGGGQMLISVELHISCDFPGGGGSPGGGGTLIFSHIRRLGPFFWVQNSEFQYFFGSSEKWLYFWGMKILWIFLGGHYKIGLVWWAFLCNLGSFFKVKVQNWDIFLGC